MPCNNPKCPGRVGNLRRRKLSQKKRKKESEGGSVLSSASEGLSAWFRDLWGVLGREEENIEGSKKSNALDRFEKGRNCVTLMICLAHFCDSKRA